MSETEGERFPYFREVRGEGGCYVFAAGEPRVCVFFAGGAGFRLGQPWGLLCVVREERDNQRWRATERKAACALGRRRPANDAMVNAGFILMRKLTNPSVRIKGK